MRFDVRFHGQIICKRFSYNVFQFWWFNGLNDCNIIVAMKEKKVFKKLF